MTEDKDPTGMRHLLASLKESGPMPDDLAERIRASLEDEQTARASGELTADADEIDDADEPSGFWSTMATPSGGSGRRRAAAPWLLGAAAATVVALAVGTGMLRNSGNDASSDAGAGAAPSSQGRSGAAEQGSSATSSSAASDEEVPAFAITETGTAYTRSSLASEAATLLEDPAGAPKVRDDEVLGTMTTAAGAADCLARLGQPQMQAVVIDIGTFEGKDGLLLVAESLPDGPARAWAVTSGCEPIWPDSVEVPSTK